jgi:hypothetical protein
LNLNHGSWAPIDRGLRAGGTAMGMRGVGCGEGGEGSDYRSRANEQLAIIKAKRREA